MAQAIWKGSISFGLVYVPVALYAAATESGIDFDWLDQRDLEPVGYRRINKKSGREVAPAQIVKGVKVGDGRYVVLGDAEIRAAYPKTTQTIAIESFAAAALISFAQFERPYFLEPLPKGEKVYTLLREAMRRTGVVAIARVVLHTKEHLAAVIATERALMLNTLRWAGDLRPADALAFPPAGHAAIKGAELAMAQQLIESMTAPWNPAEHQDRFTDAIHELVARRVKAGRTEQVAPLEAADDAAASNVVDLTALLKQSLGRRSASEASTSPKPARAPAAKRAAKTARRAAPAPGRRRA